MKHQRFVGTGYFDAVQQVITSGRASTMALEGSTEEAQFTRVIDLSVEPGHGHAIATPSGHGRSINDRSIAHGYVLGGIRRTDAVGRLVPEGPAKNSRVFGCL